MARIEFSSKVRDQAAQRAAGRCQKCGGAYKRPEFDHILPLALGGKSELSNCQVLCEACHKDKTAKSDVPRIRKADRQRRASLGIKPPGANQIKSAPFPSYEKAPKIGVGKVDKTALPPLPLPRLMRPL